ncbi:hypothetical protein CVT25_005295 [Psilocybe cyanescens]|uniref:DUF659 domain-containing protein n=1 Tax=Psilocybe cyanescens TaxID=93625 RepID=A0A409WWW1_PSICY|nr:hypothetical protein CVT25_005295 [Psilocybe cyanescens]
MAPSSGSRGGNRSWYRAYFYDHPHRTDYSHLFGTSGGPKSVLQANDASSVAAGFMPHVRSDDILKDLLYASEALVVQAHSVTMVNHLIKCEHQSQDVKIRAQQQKAAYSTSSTRSPNKRTTATRFLQFSDTQAGPSDFQPEFSVPGTLVDLGLLNSPSIPQTSLPGPSSYEQNIGRYHPYSRLGPTASISSPAIFSPITSEPSVLESANSFDSLEPSDSASAIFSQPVRTLRRSISGSGNRSAQIQASNYPAGISQEMLVPRWSSARKKRFEHRILRLTASAGFPLSWVANPEWHAFCDEFTPGAPKISRKVLTRRILREVVAEFREEVKKQVKGKNATIQEDGWTGINNRHLVAFMITANRKIHTVDVQDTTRERKTAENLLKELERVYTKLKDEWEVVVTGVVTDASGESRKARRLFAAKYPFLIVLDCYSHQINLVVGDFFKSKSTLLKYTELASQLITWLRSKTRILAHLPLSVLRAVLTRWTVHYMAYRRLLQLYPTLKSLVYSDFTKAEADKVLISGDAASKRKAQEMVDIIEDSVFWHSIALITRYLEPLAIAANIVQDSFCRIDQVLLTLGFLIKKYTDMSEDIISRDAIIDSIETRWAKCDQGVFICALLVNPFYRTSPLASLPIFNLSRIRSLFVTVYTRLNKGQSPPLEFVEQIWEFLDGTGYFSTLEDDVKFELESAREAKRQPDPLRVLNSFSLIDSSRPQQESPFISFARQILSVSANSASCERLFSLFGQIVTKLRNRTGNSVLLDLSEVKMHVRDDHIAAGSKTRLKRHFSAGGTVQNSTSAPAASAPVENIINDILRSSGDHSSSSATNAAISRSEAVDHEFSDIISEHTRLLDEDNQDNDPVVPPSAAWTPRKISEIFDFNNAAWCNRFSHFASLSFEDELALYELVDLDAAGDDDPDVDIGLDATTEDILTG